MKGVSMLRRLVGITVIGGEAVLTLGQTANNTGINVDYLHDSDNTPLLTDVIRTYRDVNSINASYNLNNATLDANGWPTEDAWYFLGDPNALANASGTYAIKFNGEATIAIGTAVTTTTGTTSYVSNQQYDPTTNTTTATITVPAGLDLSQLFLSNTQQTATSATNTGVTNIQLERPTTSGGSTPYAFNSTFTNQELAIASKVNVLRFMDYLGTNSSSQVNWSDRVTPEQVQLDPVDPLNPTNSRGKGGPLELAVALGNAANKDIWINIPAEATNDYVQKVADLIKYGSDGVNPYTSTQANPVYKPLNPNLHVYVEYSNETWNTAGGFKQNGEITQLAEAEVASYDGAKGALNFDGTTNTTDLADRYSAQRTKQIADIFAGVYGNSALLNTVRPVLDWQKGNGNGTATQDIKELNDYYNNVGGTYVSNPEPINSYIYGGGGDAYYSGTVTATSTTSSIIASADVSTNGQFASKYKDVAFATTFGLKPIAYEGGLALPSASSTSATTATEKAALADPGMEQLLVKNHTAWTSMGGDLLVYYFASDQAAYAFSDSNFSTTTPKLNGLTDLQNSAASTTYTVGTPIVRSQQTSIVGGEFTIDDASDGAYNGAKTLSGSDPWASYLINIPTAGEFKVSGDVQIYGTGGYSVYLGGALLYKVAGLVGNSKYVAFPAQLLDLPAGVTSISVQWDSSGGNVSVQDLNFTPFPSIAAIPEPASIAFLALTGGFFLRRRRDL